MSKFRSQNPTITEVTICNGGSLPMRHKYFGQGTRVVGIDLEPACKKYQTDATWIFIGDQGDREFWRTLLDEVGQVAIIVDDGGHHSGQHIITLEACLTNLRPGGILLIENVQGGDNRFLAYLNQLAKDFLALTEVTTLRYPSKTVEDYKVQPLLLQQYVKSIALFPYCVIRERNDYVHTNLTTIRAGSQWELFSHASKGK
ncbi:hypothetical protein [Ferrimicrobium sp.]|uniref:hypothetical protein n=1 Tax=Ferrimicrobium sp. TaxID=2926050 RepID=UPI002623FBAA|nr:hypothetical protein [Ferrimicrobium sp.]